MLSFLPESEHDRFLKNLQNLQNAYQDEEEIFLAKKAFILSVRGKNKGGVRTNALISTLTNIFSICQAVNLVSFTPLYQGPRS